MDSPTKLALEVVKLPFTLRPFQVETVDELAPLEGSGGWLDTGVGKTCVSTVMAYYMMLMGYDQVIVTAPPIVTFGWLRWLQSLDPAPSVTMYRGTPAQRKKLNFDAKFTLMSHQIFKIDYDRICHETRKKKVVLIVDEAHCLKNVETDNFKFVRDFPTEHRLILLSGTPLTTPADAYAYTKLIAPGCYRNLKQFTNIHVDEVDFFGNVVSWKNLDLLASNMKVNAVRLLKTDVLKDLPPVIYNPIYYELEPEHYRLYKELAEEQLLPLKNGGKIDATVEQTLHHALQQIVLNWAYFADDPSKTPKGFDLIDQILDELVDKKLIVFSIYRMSNRALVERYGNNPKINAVAGYGDISVTQQQKNVRRFIEDPKCRLFIGQPSSIGVGVDGMQAVCTDVLFLELPPTPKDFHQAVARVWREGQKLAVNVRIGVADRTLQYRKMKQLLAKDELVNRVVRSYQDLRDSIFGE